MDLKDHNGNSPLQLAKGRKHTDIINYFATLSAQRSSYLPKLNFK